MPELAAGFIWVARVTPCAARPPAAGGGGAPRVRAACACAETNQYLGTIKRLYVLGTNWAPKPYGLDLLCEAARRSRDTPRALQKHCITR
eukprot:SAG31_NODE_2979_length_4829_cov_6.315645_1_plen_90_part_00